MENDIIKKSNQSINAQLQDLLDKVNDVIKDIDEASNNFATQFNEINSNINESIIAVEKIYSELDQIEKEAGDEMDRLILQQAEDIAEE